MKALSRARSTGYWLRLKTKAALLWATEAFIQYFKGLYSRSRSCSTITGTNNYSMAFDNLSSGRKQYAWKWGTKVIHWTITDSVPIGACTAGYTGIVSAYGLSIKDCSASSTWLGKIEGGTLLDFLQPPKRTAVSAPVVNNIKVKGDCENKTFIYEQVKMTLMFGWNFNFLINALDNISFNRTLLLWYCVVIDAISASFWIFTAEISSEMRLE